MMEDDSGESTGVDEVAGVGRVTVRVVGPRLSQRSRKLIPETRRGILKGTVSDP